jgi:hypothetical protein
LARELRARKKDPKTPQQTSNGIVEQGVNAFSSYYDSLNIRLQKRFTNGLTLINNLVWSSLVSETSYFE